MDKYSFQNCQKIVVFSSDLTSVLLCKRKGEVDYDGTFSFIGGKMETTDDSIIVGIKREKNEEVGENFKIKLFPIFNSTVFFKKKDGSSMVLPHYFAKHITGEVHLSEEYSEYQWVKISLLKGFEPKIKNIPDVVENLLRLKPLMKEDEFIIM